MYQRVPYPLRYLIALMMWAVLMAGALVLKFFLIWCIPIVFLMSGFGANQTQNTAQYNATLADLFIYMWPRFPRANLHRLLGRRRSADSNPEFIEYLPRRRV